MLNLERYYHILMARGGSNFAITKDTKKIVNCDSMSDCSNCYFAKRENQCAEEKIIWLMEEAPLVDSETLDFLKCLNVESIRLNNTKGELEIFRDETFSAIPYTLLNLTKLNLNSLKSNTVYKVEDLIAEGEKSAGL